MLDSAGDSFDGSRVCGRGRFRAIVLLSAVWSLTSACDGLVGDSFGSKTASPSVGPTASSPATSEDPVVGDELEALADAADAAGVGEPFPLGVFQTWFPLTSDDLARLREAGFRWVMSYTNGGAGFLDDAQNHAMGVIYPLKDVAPQNIPGIVRGVKDHPALRGYYTNDELNVVRPGETADGNFSLAQARYAAVKGEDPNHPVLGVAVVGGAADSLNWQSTLDWFAFDNYPVGTSFPLRTLYSYPNLYRDRFGVTKPIWAVPQLSRVNGAGGQTEVSLAELRVMAYAALIGRVEGLFWFSYGDAFVDFGDSGPTVTSADSPVFLERWNRVRSLMRELTLLARSVLHGTDVGVEGVADSEDFLFRPLRFRDKTYVLAVNTDPGREHTVVLTGVRAATVLSGVVNVSQAASSGIQLRLGAYEAATLRVE